MNFQSIFNAALTTIKGTIFNVKQAEVDVQEDRAVKILSQADHTAIDHAATGDTGDTGDDTSHSDTGDDTGDTGEDTGDTGDDQPHKI